MPIFAWNIPLVSLIFLKSSLVFLILLFSSILLKYILLMLMISFIILKYKQYPEYYHFNVSNKTLLKCFIIFFHTKF